MYQIYSNKSRRGCWDSQAWKKIFFRQNFGKYYVLAYLTRFSVIFTSADKSCLTYPYPTRWKDKNRIPTVLSIHWLYRRSHNSESWRHCDIICNFNFQYGKRQYIGMWLVNGDSYIKIKCWRSKRIYHGCLVHTEKSLPRWAEKHVPRYHCLASLGTASWCQTVTLG